MRKLLIILLISSQVYGTEWESGRRRSRRIADLRLHEAMKTRNAFTEEQMRAIEKYDLRGICTVPVDDDQLTCVAPRGGN